MKEFLSFGASGDAWGVLQGYGGVLLDFGKTFGHDPLEVLLLMCFFFRKDHRFDEASE